MTSHKRITYLPKEEDKNIIREIDILQISFEPQSLSKANSLFYSSFKTLEKTCSERKGHLPTQGILGKPTFHYISLQNLANRLHEKQKVGLARRVTHLARSPFFDSRVTLLARPNILHVNTLAHPGGSTWSRQENQSMCKHCCQLLAQAKGLTPFSYKCSLKLTWLGG